MVKQARNAWSLVSYYNIEGVGYSSVYQTCACQLYLPAHPIIAHILGVHNKHQEWAIHTPSLLCLLWIPAHIIDLIIPLDLFLSISSLSVLCHFIHLLTASFHRLYL